MKPKIIAHRCGTDKYPELTIDAALHSLTLGADVVEVDVRLTKDNIPVIAHDRDCNRLFGDASVIEYMSADQFTQLKYTQDNSYHGITLGEYLSKGIKPLLLHIKDKNKDYTPIFKVIKKYNYQSDIILGIVSLAQFASCQNQLPDTPVLAFMPLVEDLEDILLSKVKIIRLWQPWITKERIDAIHQSGKKVWVMSGTPKTGTAGYIGEAELISLLDHNIDGILINEIAIAKRFT